MLFFWAVSLPAQENPGPCPCCGDEYKQFDFWIGDWVVYQNGRTVGFNKITKIEANCVLRENWKSYVSSHTGTSYNFYDKESKKWKHLWIDSDGKSLYLTGAMKGDRMVMQSEERRDEKGNRILDRVTWIKNADGTVRQIWERSEDGGMDYKVQFDGIYRKRK